MKSTVLYTLFVCSIILTFLSVAFFIMFLVCYSHHDHFSKTGQYSTDKEKWPPYLKGIIAMEFLMFIFAIVQLVFFICAFKCYNPTFAILAAVSAVLFFVCWIISILLFNFSPEYDFIKSINTFNPDSDVKLYSWDSFKEQMTKWSHKKPSLYLELVGISNDQICSDFINITTVQNIKNSVELDPINFNDISGDSLIMVDIQVEIKYDSENEKKLNDLQKDIKKCADSKGVASTVSKIDGLDKIPDAVLITKNGEIPSKLKKNLAITRAIFGMGFDVITDILSFPIYDRKIKISETTFDYSFDCSKLQYQCIQIPNETKTMNLKKKTNSNLSYWSKMKNILNEHIIKLFKRKIPKSYNRERLSRSFYLSKAAYTGDFRSYEGKTFSSGNLIEIIKSNIINGKFRPNWYMGTHGKDLYVTIRGSNSLNDFLTDAAFGVSTEIDLSYHRGFYYAARYVWGEIESDARKYRNEGYTIVFTGHSYGGSVAQILHRFAHASFGGGVCSYVFGAAASMGKNTASLIKNECYSFVYCNDIVPRLMNYVQSSKGVLSLIPLLQAITLDINIGSMKNSENWGSTGNEKITEPVGTIYHLPYHDDAKSNWGSISSTKTNIEYSFYQYNFHSIQYAKKDHDLGMYYTFLQYYDGLMMPSEM